MYRFGHFAPSPAPAARPAPRGEALQSLLAADGLRDRFFAWRGASGRRYVCSVFQSGETGFVADVTDGLIIGVARDGAMARPLCLLRARIDAAALHRQARELGVTEWHVLFGESDAPAGDLAGALLN